MTITISPTSTEGVERRLQVSVPSEDVRAAEDKAARKYASQARLPGFRPGKAPAAMVRKRFAPAIRQEALERLVQDAWTQAMEQEKLDPVSQPHIHDLKFDDGDALSFELHLEVRPVIELANTSGFTVTRPSVEVTDELVNQQIEELRDQKASWAPVEEKPMPGDMVTVLLSTSEADGTMPEGREYRIVLGTGQAIEGVEEVIMDTEPGQTTEQSVRWPDDFPDEEQRGQSKTVRVELRDVKRKAMPAVDDAFAREVGDFDSVAALDAAMRSDMAKYLEREADASVRQQLVEQLVQANQFEIPRAWVVQVAQAYVEGYQVPEEDREKFLEQIAPVAEQQVRRDVIIDTLSEREGLKATESDLDNRVAEMAEERGVEPGQLYASLQKAGRLSELERGITEDRVFSWLIEQNTIQQA
ncbi:MAG TPA: trigger factor [Gemmatimonadales bacterium]|nr:trigger factor [Gemmatimonadales bacterium]